MRTKDTILLENAYNQVWENASKCPECDCTVGHPKEGCDCKHHNSKEEVKESSEKEDEKEDEKEETTEESIRIPISLFNKIRGLLLAEAAKKGTCAKCGKPNFLCKCKGKDKGKGKDMKKK
jgi:hypothetical protein